MFARSAVAYAVVVAASFVAGYWARQPNGPVSAHGSRQVLYYACPMHPGYKSEKPGDAPCCGMRLEPVYANSSALHAASTWTPGTVEIGPRQQQLIGVRVGTVERSSESHVLRVPGRVAVDEGRFHRLIAASGGWIRKLANNPPGTFVQRHELLATFYTRELLSAQQQLLYSLNARDEFQKRQANLTSRPTAGTLNLQAAIDGLRNLGMHDMQIEEIARTAATAEEIKVYSPISGFVIARGVSPEQRFENGSELFRIADLGHVWVMTDIFERDRDLVRPGSVAVVRYQGRTFEARMSGALPQFDAQSRTLKTRFEVGNPGYVLRPDMFVDVEVHVTTAEAVTVPADAVIDSGSHRTVYVEVGKGVFEPRLVDVGWRLGDRVQITRGLSQGERVVVSGNFLIDSESRMRLTAMAATAPAGKKAVEKDPVCGMDVDPAVANAIKAEHRGTSWFFCSEQCRRNFLAAPEKYRPENHVPIQSVPHRKPS